MRRADVLRQQHVERAAQHLLRAMAEHLLRAAAEEGPGIPAEAQAAIFEPFHPLEPARQKHTPGVGLGLALVREVVEALGGRVELDSAPGRGSTFTVWLPPVPERKDA